MIDKTNLKLKYLTGQYLNLETIEPDDIIFFVMSKNKKSMNIEDIRKTVANTEYKMKEFDVCIQNLVDTKQATIADEILTITQQ